MFVLTIHPGVNRVQENARAMKTKTKHRKGHMWRKKANSSPIAKGRRPKRAGRNQKKARHFGGVGLK